MIATNRSLGQQSRTMQIFGAQHGAVPVQESAQLQCADKEAPIGKAKSGFRVSPWISLALALLLAFPALKGFAQYDTGSLVGVVHDATGAVIPGVKITVENKSTNARFTAVSNGAGEYQVPSLHTGLYKITAEHTGFGTAVADSITVSVGEPQHIDLMLQVGQNATTIEVSGVALQIQTDSSQRNQVITGYQSQALPLVSRNYTDLLGLVTGVRQAPTQATTTTNINSPVRAGAYNVNGQRSMFNNFLLDGMDNNAYGESQPGLRQSDHLHPAGLRCPIQRGHQQRERGVRPRLGRNH